MYLNIPQGNIICGNMVIPQIVPQLITTFIYLMKMVIPIILIIFGMLDMVKAVISKTEEDMKKHQSLFIKRIIYSVLLYLIVAIVEIMLSLINVSNDSLIGSCINALLGK